VCAEYHPIEITALGIRLLEFRGSRTGLRGRDQSASGKRCVASVIGGTCPDAHIELVDDGNHMVFVDQPDIVQTLLTGVS
jgi:hypothetical protein